MSRYNWQSREQSAKRRESLGNGERTVHRMVSERSLAVLRVIVQDYVASREPVGSKTIVERHSFGVSAATIRNDMAQLEEEELIAAPHTSSGRVPTDKGYRVFVDQLTDLRPLSSGQRQAIETFLGQAVDLDDVLARTVRLLSQLTNQVALAQYPVVRQLASSTRRAGRARTDAPHDGAHHRHRTRRPAAPGWRARPRRRRPRRVACGLQLRARGPRTRRRREESEPHRGIRRPRSRAPSPPRSPAASASRSRPTGRIGS